MGLVRLLGVVFLFVFSLNQSFGQSPYRRIGEAPVQLLEATASGRLLLKPLNHSGLFLWKESSPQVVSLSRNTIEPKMVLSEDGKRLLLKGAGFEERFNDLTSLDIDSDDLKQTLIEETRPMEPMPILARDGQSYLVVDNAATAPTLWNFPLAEYLWDAVNGSTQPTGFYLDGMSVADITKNVSTGVYSPDGNSVAWIARPNAPAATRHDVYDPDLALAAQQGSLQILDLLTMKLTSYTLPEYADKIHWNSENELYLEKSSQLALYTIADKQYQIMLSGFEGLKLSRDGNWLIYQGRANNKDEAFTLVNLKTRKQFVFKEASSGVFLPDSSAIIFSRKTKAQEKPFVKVALTPYLEETAPNVLSLSDASLVGFGESFPVWEVPTDPAPFATNFDFKDGRKSDLAGMGWDFTIVLLNKGKEFMGFDPEKPFGLDCELFDDTGKLWVKWTAEDNDAAKQIAPRLGPGQAMTLDCGVATEVPLPVPFNGEIRYRIRGYETASEGKIAVP